MMSTKLERLVQMDALIRTGTHPSVKSFRERFEISERTVHDDLEFLRDRLNAPLEHSRLKGGYYYTDKTWALPAFFATEGQLLAFFLSMEVTHRYLGTSFEMPLREAIARLMELLPETVQVSLSELSAQYSIRQGATASSTPETLLSLHEAIRMRHPVEMVYFTAERGEERQRTIHPYHLVNARGEWHLLAYDRWRQEVRQFALPRIREWHVERDEQFDVDPTFSLEDYFAKSFQSEHGNRPVEVVIAFDKYQAHYVRERPWHPSQQIEELAGGGLILRFSTGAQREVQRWVLECGSHVRVLAPPDLVAAVIEEHRASLRQYENPPQTADISQ